MKKTSNHGFVLLETLIVTVFISGVLIFLFSQFVSLNRNYDESYKYNSVEDIYALYNIINYIKNDTDFYNKIRVTDNEYTNITDCSLATNTNFCIKLFKYEDVENIIVTKNNFNKDYMLDLDEDLKTFIDKIHPKGKEKCRLIVKFKHKVESRELNEESNTYDKVFEHNSFATIRFGDENE